jgi:hypothetical protein
VALLGHVVVALLGHAEPMLLWLCWAMLLWLCWAILFGFTCAFLFLALVDTLNVVFSAAVCMLQGDVVDSTKDTFQACQPSTLRVPNRCQPCITLINTMGFKGERVNFSRCFSVSFWGWMNYVLCVL